MVAMARTEQSCASACAATLAFGRVSITSAPVPTRMCRVTPFSVSSDQTTPTDRSLVIRSPVCARRGSLRPVVVLALDLQPRPAATRTVRRIPSLRHDPFQPEGTRVLQDQRAVALQRLAQSQAGMRATQQSGQAFPSLLKWRWAQVRAIHGEKVERKQACVLRRLRPQPMEVVARLLTFENGFAVQHDASSPHCPERFDNQRKRRRPAQTATAPQPHALAILAGNDAVSVVLDGG